MVTKRRTVEGIDFHASQCPHRMVTKGGQWRESTFTHHSVHTEWSPKGGQWRESTFTHHSVHTEWSPKGRRCARCPVTVSTGGDLHVLDHTPSIAFRHPPPNSARFSYATEGALFISAQLSTDAVSALRKVWVLI